ncbi:MAG TPA: TIGR04211 family SH3 domain-containing protein [Deltaproteobacteria bacterium]|jgi:SH3 domain protein|nr:TIGR04211 family SH3 domain-containing protein [Deltaproteobacteria bacterium]HOI08763.1 TIGR04211 family SH3 domain-containing protein [Deltaproteobacteria bacterium]
MMNAAKAATVLACLLFIGAPLQHALAAGLYVREGANVPVREAPYDNARITGMATQSDYLEILEGKGEWLRIKTPKGEEGWVPNRYLTRQMPKTLVVDQLNEKIKSLTQENLALQEENAQLQKENRERSYRISGVSKEVEEARKQYETLKLESSQYLDLKNRYLTLQAQYKDMSQKLDQATRENNKLKTSERIIFTLVGGAFIVMGIVIGTLLQVMRSKPKKGGYKF